MNADQPGSSPSGVATPRIGVVTVSDRASRGVYQDLGGPDDASGFDVEHAGGMQHDGMSGGGGGLGCSERGQKEETH